MSILYKSCNVIDTFVSFALEGFHCKISWVYGDPNENKKKLFWGYLCRRLTVQAQPWICLGDFNEVQWSSEKWGGNPQPHWRMNLFNQFLTQNDLRDLHYQGPCFTWYRYCHGQLTLQERLDRCVGNPSWCASKPKAQVFNLPKVGSDHRPILLDSSPRESWSPKLFRFEHIWTTSEMCGQIVAQAWKSAMGPDAMPTWIANLHTCKNSLLQW